MRSKKEFRDPKEVAIQEWKNRYRISAKLQGDIYVNFYKYCTDNNLSINSGVNHLLQTHPPLQNNV